MRKLMSLCDKLKRLGQDVCVICHGRCDYTVFWWTAHRGEFRRDLHSIKECEHFLLSLFRL